MTLFIRITRTFSCLFLLVSLKAFSATFNFHIINSSDSIANPITITSGIMHSYSYLSDPGCESKSEPFTSDLKVAKGEEGIFSYDPKYPANCYTTGWISVSMEIVTVDGKGIKNTCSFYSNASGTNDPNENIYVGTVKITEMRDRFLCEFPIGASKTK